MRDSLLEYANFLGRHWKRETGFRNCEKWSERVQESRGSAWSPSEVHGIPRKEWESLGRAWDSSEEYGVPWKEWESLGSEWKSLGSAWDPSEVHGS